MANDTYNFPGVTNAQFGPATAGGAPLPNQWGPGYAYNNAQQQPVVSRQTGTGGAIAGVLIALLLGLAIVGAIFVATRAPAQSKWGADCVAPSACETLYKGEQNLAGKQIDSAEKLRLAEIAIDKTRADQTIDLARIQAETDRARVAADKARAEADAIARARIASSEADAAFAKASEARADADAERARSEARRAELERATIRSTVVVPTVVPTTPGATSVLTERGGKGPSGSAPNGYVLRKGQSGDPGCFTLPSGVLRCPNTWVPK